MHIVTVLIVVTIKIFYCTIILCLINRHAGNSKCKTPDSPSKRRKSSRPRKQSPTKVIYGHENIAIWNCDIAFFFKNEQFSIIEILGPFHWNFEKRKNKAFLVKKSLFGKINPFW